MIIDIGGFDASRLTVLNYFRGKGGGDIQRTISMMAQATGVPCIVISHWLGVETNWHPDTVKSIQRLKDFYGYTEILNRPPGSPPIEGIK